MSELQQPTPAEIEQIRQGASPPAPENVYQKINRVMGAISKEGIAKMRGDGLKYEFRGVDQVYNTLAPILSEVGLLILPEVLDRTTTERPSKSGGVLMFVVLTVRYTFVSVDDGSQHMIVVPGEAMDSGDKATNKAMSAAYKYACFQTFCIPLEGQDSEMDSPEISSVDMQKVNKIMETLELIFVVDGMAKEVSLIDDSDNMDPEAELDKICDVLNTNSDVYLKVWKQIDVEFPDKLDGRSTVASKMRAYIKEFNKARS